MRVARGHFLLFVVLSTFVTKACTRDVTLLNENVTAGNQFELPNVSALSKNRNASAEQTVRETKGDEFQIVLLSSGAWMHSLDGKIRCHLRKGQRIWISRLQKLLTPTRFEQSDTSGEQVLNFKAELASEVFVERYNELSTSDFTTITITESAESRLIPCPIMDSGLIALEKFSVEKLLGKATLKAKEETFFTTKAVADRALLKEEEVCVVAAGTVGDIVFESDDLDAVKVSSRFVAQAVIAEEEEVGLRLVDNFFALRVASFNPKPAGPFCAEPRNGYVLGKAFELRY